VPPLGIVNGTLVCKWHPSVPGTIVLSNHTLPSRYIS